MANKRYQIVHRLGDAGELFDVIDNLSTQIDDVKFSSPSRKDAEAYLYKLEAKRRGLTARIFEFVGLREADATRSGPQWERFWDEYAKQLAQAMIDKPGDYMPGIDAATVAARMKTAATNSGIGSINIHSEGFKRTCKVFGIKPTYKGIDAFFGGSTWTEAAADSPARERAPKRWCKDCGNTLAMQGSKFCGECAEWHDAHPEQNEAKESLRLPGSNSYPGSFIVLNRTRNEFGEYVVKVMINGKSDEGLAYYTNDWDDAVATAKSMAADSATESIREAKLHEAKCWKCGRPTLDIGGAGRPMCDDCLRELGPCSGSGKVMSRRGQGMRVPCPVCGAIVLTVERREDGAEVLAVHEPGVTMWLEDANPTYVWGVFKDGKGGFYANSYYSENTYPALVQGNLTQAQAMEQAEAENLKAQLGESLTEGFNLDLWKQGRGVWVVPAGRVAEMLGELPHPERTSADTHGWDTLFKEWPNREAMARFIRKAEQNEMNPKIKAVVPLAGNEGY